MNRSHRRFDHAGATGPAVCPEGVPAAWLPPPPAARAKMRPPLRPAGRFAAILLALAALAVAVGTRPVAAEDGLPPVVVGLPVGGVVPVSGGAEAPVEVTRLVLSVDVQAEEANLSLLPARVVATVEARYVLRLAGEGDRPRTVSFRFLAPPEVDAQWDGRPAELYPSPYPGTEPSPSSSAASVASPVAPTMWLDPLTGRFYPVGEPPVLGSSQALGTDGILRPGQEHQLRLRFPRVALGWDGNRYLSPAYQLEVPLAPDAWASFGPVDVHVALPQGYVASVAAGGRGGADAASGPEDAAGRSGPDGGEGGRGRYVYRRWEVPPQRVVAATTATAGMWGRLVTHRRDVLWLLAVTWLAFAAARAGLWRIGRRRDAWAWAALPALLVLPVAAGWVSWHSLRVPLWGYPFSLLQYALWLAGGLYVAGRILGDLGGFLWLRWRYWRAGRQDRRLVGDPGGPVAPAAGTQGRRGSRVGLTARAGRP